MKTDVQIEMFPPWLHVPSALPKNGTNEEEAKGVDQNTKRQKRRYVHSANKTQLSRKNAYRSSQSYFSKSATSKLSTTNLLHVKSLNRISKMRAKSLMSTSSSGYHVRSHDEQYLRKTTEVCKISYPCNSGCATCAFTNCFGPVKIYISQYNEPKQCVVQEIKDGQGRATIPKSRLKEFRGLIYDKQTHSLYPPIPRGYTNTHLQRGNRKLFH